MDGTIYQLNGENNGYKNSSLHKEVKKNAAKFFSEREQVSLEDGLKIVEDLNNSGSILSLHAMEKYGIPKKDFYESVWNIDPQSIVVNYQEAVEVITELANRNIELILLTQSPQIWQSNVFTFIGLNNLFAKIFTADSYINKSEVYSQIAKTKNPKTILAIGDQLESDILPAQELGFFTFLVSSPKDLKNIFQ